MSARRIPALVVVAVLAALPLFVAQLLGFRDHVSVLSGTGTASGNVASEASGLVYAAAWFSALLVAPVCVVAALVQTLLLRLLAGPTKGTRNWGS